MYRFETTIRPGSSLIHHTAKRHEDFVSPEKESTDSQSVEGTD